MTNYEWLLQMGGEERQAWFDAEHVDANDVSTRKGDVRADDVCANDGFMDLDSCTHGVRTFASETDSREKLEDDVVHECARPGFGPEFGEIMVWLNRQAAITEQECREYEDELRKQHHKRVEKLTAERDEWKAKAKSILNTESYKFASEPDAESYIDCGKVENDSREKLEEDMSQYVLDAWAQGWEAGQHDDMDCCNFYIDEMRALLDRQAAITRAEESHGWRMAASGPIYEYRQERDRLRAELDEVKAERDAIARDLAECDENRIEFRDQRDHAEEMLAQMERERDYWELHTDCWADKCVDAEAERDAYHERTVELEIELAQANGILKNTTHNHAAAKAKYERALADAARAREKQLEAERKYAELLEKPPEGAWAERIANLEAGNEELREKLSEALGHAHEIGKLADLEGVCDGR